MEQPQSAPWCQRWREQRSHWRDAGRDTSFDPARYEVGPICEADARRFVEQHHYSGSYPAALRRLGMRTRVEGQLVGVAVFGAPTSSKVLTGPFPTLEPYTASMELARFVLLDEVPANAETWFLARAFRHLHSNGVRGVVSFSDPVPRTALDGKVLLRGHVGTIYQASSAMYAGRGTARTLTLLPDGTVLNARAAQKVRAQEQGHGYVEERLVRLGAKPLTRSVDPTEWLNHALLQIGARRLRHPGAHRYLFRLGTSRERRRIPTVADQGLPYPKKIDQVTPRTFS